MLVAKAAFGRIFVIKCYTSPHWEAKANGVHWAGWQRLPVVNWHQTSNLNRLMHVWDGHYSFICKRVIITALLNCTINPSLKLLGEENQSQLSPKNSVRSHWQIIVRSYVENRLLSCTSWKYCKFPGKNGTKPKLITLDASTSYTVGISRYSNWHSGWTAQVIVGRLRQSCTECVVALPHSTKIILVVFVQRRGKIQIKFVSLGSSPILDCNRIINSSLAFVVSQS